MANLRTLGIDLGTNSIGWSLIETNGEPGEDITAGRIIVIGTRIFSQSEFAGRDPQSKTSLAVARREARAARRRRDRYLARRGALFRTLISFGLLPETEAAQKQLLIETGDRSGGDLTFDVYALRKRALDEALTPHQIGRVFFHLDQRRGFKSNRKTDSRDNEAGKIAVGVARLEQAMMADEARTYGEFLHKRRLKGQSIRTRLRPESGEGVKGDGYDFYPSRSALEAEFDLIASKQATFHGAMLTPERVSLLRSIIFYQRPLKAPIAGRCSYHPNEKRLPKAHPLFQEFRLLKEVNELAIIGEDQSQSKLTRDQRDALLLELRSKKKVSFTTLRRRLKLGTEWRFNKHTENRVGLLGDEIRMEMASEDCFGARWSAWSWREQWSIIERLRETEDVKALCHWLRLEHGVSPECAENIANAMLPEGFGRLGQTALSNLADALVNETNEDGKVITEAEAARRVYGKTNSERDLDESAHDLLPPYQEVLERHIPPGTGNKDDVYDVFKGRITNPTVHIALNQLRKVINALIASHGKPDRIAIELGRDMKLSDAARDEVNKEIGRNTRAAEARSAKLLELKQKDTGYNRLRLKLWEELPPTPEARVCVYTGRPISLAMVFSNVTEIDHILPYSKTLDDSQGNMILCTVEGNRQKRKRAPAEVIEWHSHYDEILARAAILPRNKNWRFAENAMSKFEGENDFLARQMTDMQYIARMALTYLASLYPAEEADIDGVLRRHNRVRALPGKMTEMLRRNWALNELLPDHNYTDAVKKKNRRDHRHHAIDATVIACTSRSLIKRLATASAQAEVAMAERIAAKVPEPWARFREDLRTAVQAIVVSHKPDHGTISRAGYAAGKGQTAGKLHNDTAYGLAVDKHGSERAVHRVALTSFKKAEELDTIRDDQLREMLQRVTKGCSGKEFEAAVIRFAREKQIDGTANPFLGLRHVRILEPLKVIPIRDESGRLYKAYKGDSNYRYDVWKTRDGKWKSEVVTTFDAHSLSWKSPLREANTTAKKVLSLQQNDVLALNVGNERTLYRVVKFGATGAITLAGIQESGSLKARDADKNDPFKYVSKSASSLKAEQARQIRIDELGRLYDPGPRN